MTASSIYVDATTLIALGTIGELDLLTAFDGTPVVLPTVARDVTTEPAATNLDRLIDRGAVGTTSPASEVDDERARDVLGGSSMTGDVRLIASVLAHADADEPVAIVSDDRRVRTVARGLGARVTGIIGTIVRAVEEGMAPERGTELVRRVDSHGLHLTGELREAADELIEDAGT